MNHSSIYRLILTTGFCILTTILFTSCGQKEKSGAGSQESESHNAPEDKPAAEKPAAESKESAEGHDDHGSEAAGASYQEGKGIALLEETKKSLGLELAEVAEQSIWPNVRLTAQIYRSASEASRTYGHERQGNAYATSLVSQEMADQLKPGQKFAFVCKNSADANHEGVVLKIDRAQVPILGKAEALLELPDPDQSLAVGAFVEAEAPIGSAPQKMLSIPHSALLETSTGTYAFVQNGGFLLRTEIKTGARSKDTIEVTEGLYEGDTIAVKPVEALYLIELRTTKGGGHSH